MELYQLNIFPKNYHKPDLVLVYTLNDNKEIDTFKIWISDTEKNDLELLNYANLLLYHILLTNDNTPTQKCIYKSYQVLFGLKQWKPYEEIKTFINNEKTILKAPYSKYVEITKEYINEKINEIYNKYIKGENKNENN